MFDYSLLNSFAKSGFTGNFLWFLKVHTMGLLMSTSVYLYQVGFFKYQVAISDWSQLNGFYNLDFFLKMLKYESVRIIMTSKIGLKVFSSNA